MNHRQVCRSELFYDSHAILQADASLEIAALRETREELSISPERIEILGTFGPAIPNLRGNLLVWPFVVGQNMTWPMLYATHLTQGFRPC